MEETFKALADGNRRKMLDLLKEEPGQTVRQLTEHFTLSRFAVMKHLKILETAHLVVSRKSGRERHLYLNAVPLQEIYERWIVHYQAVWAANLLALKRELEDENEHK